MDNKQKKQQELIELLNVEAEEAKIRLHKIVETTKIKSDRQKSNIRKRAETVRENMYTKQQKNYSDYQSIEEDKLKHRSEMVLNKFDTQVRKAQTIVRARRINVHDHINAVEERFEIAREGQIKA